MAMLQVGYWKDLLMIVERACIGEPLDASVNHKPLNP